MNPTEKFHDQFRKPAPGRTLIVGSRVYPGREDRRLLYPDALGVDMLEGPGVDLVYNLEESLIPTSHLFAHIECRSVLEHSRRPWLLAANIERLMAPGATLDLSAPFVWRVHAYPSDYWRFTTEAIRELFPNIEWTALTYATQTSLKTKKIRVGPAVYLARSEVLAWGVRK